MCVEKHIRLDGFLDVHAVICLPNIIHIRINGKHVMMLELHSRCLILLTMCLISQFSYHVLRRPFLRNGYRL